MHQLREDFQYNLRLLDERDAELERYDRRFARMKLVADDLSRIFREEQLVAAEPKSDVRGQLQREELESHGLTLTRQVSERAKLLESQRTPLYDSVAIDILHVQEDPICRLDRADVVTSASDQTISTLERQRASLQERLWISEEGAIAAKPAPGVAEAAASQIFREASLSAQMMDARVAELQERCALAERRADRSAEDAASAAAAAAAAICLAEAAAEDARYKANAAQLRRGDEYGAECASLTSRGDTLLRRAKAADRAMETHDVAHVSAQELKERLAEASTSLAAAESSGTIKVAIAPREKFKIHEHLRLQERETAKINEKPYTLRAALIECDAENTMLKGELSAARECAHLATKDITELRERGAKKQLVTDGHDATCGVLTCSDRLLLETQARCAELERRVMTADAKASSAISARAAAEAELDSARQSLLVGTFARRDIDEFQQQDGEQSRADRLAAENERLRSSVGAMRAEMETLQRSVLTSSLGGIESNPDWTLGRTPHLDTAEKNDYSIELRLTRAEVRRLTREKARLLEISNGLRAENDRLMSTERNDGGGEHENKGKMKFNFPVRQATSGVSQMSRTCGSIRASIPRSTNERVTASQFARVKSSPRKGFEKLKVRNWNVQD